MIVVSCSCPGALCLARNLDTNFCMVGVSSCALLFVVELVVEVVGVLLLCVPRDVRGIALRRSPLGGVRSLS